MEARLEHLWIRDAWGIWITDRSGPRGGRRVYQQPEIQLGDALSTALIDKAPCSVVLDENSPTGPLPYTLALPSEWLAAIVAAGNAEAGLVSPNTSQAKHLDDALYVRDRLLDALIPVRTDG